VAFSKLDSNGDGYISLGEIVDTVPGSDDANDIDNHLIAVSQVRHKPHLVASLVSTIIASSVTSA